MSATSNKSKLSTKFNTKTSDKGKKTPQFAHKEDEFSDTKQWNGKTYYYCPANHKYSHWHRGLQHIQENDEE